MVDFEKLKKMFNTLFAEVGKVVVGQDEILKGITVSMLCDGNALLEGNPGLGKTLMIKTIAETMDLKFSRIQNTPDLMPSDITGTYIIEETTGKRHFKFQQGPIFANVILADEINRATPKTQSAFLEAMQEKQVTVGNQTFKLDPPFFVLATQNPIEQEGTYPLPEAQTDRFLLKLNLTYPTYDEEVQIVEKYTSSDKLEEIRKVMNRESIFALQKITKQIPIANDLKKRVVDIICSTRKHNSIEYGASPRASIGIILAAKAHALIEGRNHVSASDIDNMAYPILRHRIILNFEAERQGLRPDDVIKELVSKAK